MSFGLIGKKIGMTQRFAEDGSVVPVTLVQAGPCPVLQVKTMATDGYEAIQLGYGVPRKRTSTKPALAHCKKASTEPVGYLREFRVSEAGKYKPGDSITVEEFAAGEKIDVSGISKGKGFAGVMKRHKFHGSPKSHGTHRRHRAPGSVGASSFPSRVFKGKRMGGHMGNEQVTVQNLTVYEVDRDNNMLLIRGAVPGPPGSIVFVKKGIKTKKVK